MASRFRYLVEPVEHDQALPVPEERLEPGDRPAESITNPLEQQRAGNLRAIRDVSRWSRIERRVFQQDWQARGRRCAGRRAVPAPFGPVAPGPRRRRAYAGQRDRLARTGVANQPAALKARIQNEAHHVVVRGCGVGRAHHPVSAVDTKRGRQLDVEARLVRESAGIGLSAFTCTPIRPLDRPECARSTPSRASPGRGRTRLDRVRSARGARIARIALATCSRQPS